MVEFEVEEPPNNESNKSPMVESVAVDIEAEDVLEAFVETCTRLIPVGLDITGPTAELRLTLLTPPPSNPKMSVILESTEVAVGVSSPNKEVGTDATKVSFVPSATAESTMGNADDATTVAGAETADKTEVSAEAATAAAADTETATLGSSRAALLAFSLTMSPSMTCKSLLDNKLLTSCCAMPEFLRVVKRLAQSMFCTAERINFSPACIS
jgi:hypothetical protein